MDSIVDLTGEWRQALAYALGEAEVEVCRRTLEPVERDALDREKARILCSSVASICSM
jgi:hypothetical protein